MSGAQAQKKTSIIHCRVSSTKQVEGNGLEEQEIIGVGVAQRLDARVLKIFSYPHSATTHERRDFEEVIAYINKSPVAVDYYIIKGIDRLTRAGVPEYLALKERLEKLGVTVVDSYGLIQPMRNSLEHVGFEYNWSLYSPSEAAEILEALRSKQEVQHILTRMIGAEISLAKDGYQVRQPHDGFINKKIVVDGKKKTVEVPDPERAYFFVEMFELRAAGLEDALIVEQLNARGYRSRNRNRWNADRSQIVEVCGGKQLTVKQLQRIIQRPIYAGVKVEKWTNYQPVKAQYKGLVSIKLFNRANRGKVYIKEHDDDSLQVLYDYSPYGKIRKRRLSNNPLYPYKFLLCPHCRKPLLGSASRGKQGKSYPAYHCGGNKSGPRSHPYYRIPKHELDQAVEQFVLSLTFTEKFLDTLEEELLGCYRREERQIIKAAAQMSRAVGELKSEQADLLGSFEKARNQLTRQLLEEKIEALEKHIALATEQRDRIELTEADIKLFVRFAKYLMEHPGEVLLEQENARAQRALFGLLFEETPTFEEIANGTPKLSLVFRLSRDFEKGKSQVVTPLSIEWKKIVHVVTSWLNIFDTYSVVKDTTVSG